MNAALSPLPRSFSRSTTLAPVFVAFNQVAGFPINIFVNLADLIYCESDSVQNQERPDIKGWAAAKLVS